MVLRVLGLGVAVAAAAAGTALTSVGAVPLRALAASPRALGEGKVWLLFTSGLVADRPWLASLLGFALAGAVALAVCPPRLVVLVAAAGHVLSALVVYAAIWLGRLLDPGAFSSVVALPDRGVSAMIAAWIGAIARVSWVRRRSPSSRLAIAAGCLASAAIGWVLDPDLTFLDTEHVVAFAIGIAVAGLDTHPARSAIDGHGRQLAEAVGR